LLIPGSLSADTFGLFSYSDDGSEITITGYPDDEVGPVEIPAIINGKPVTRIGNSAFRDCRVSRVTTPDSVTVIGENSFTECAATRVTIGSGVILISTNAFTSCRDLSRMIFKGNAPEIRSGALSTGGNLAVYYSNGSAGFITPMWLGHQTFLGIAPTFTSAVPPAIGRVGTAYSHIYTASGTPLPDYTLTSGALPDGLTLSPAGSISGIPTLAGVFSVTITASSGIPPM
jgi:hypothetical protein